MTVEDKRLKIIKMASTSDSEGIDKMYKKLFSTSSSASNDITPDKITEVYVSTLADMIDKDPEIILLLPILTDSIVTTLKNLFEEE